VKSFFDLFYFERHEYSGHAVYFVKAWLLKDIVFDGGVSLKAGSKFDIVRFDMKHMRFVFEFSMYTVESSQKNMIDQIGSRSDKKLEDE